MRGFRIHRGFTLIELLVVVSVIGVLLSILLPALQHARQMTRRTYCGTRVRDLFTATTMYLGDDERFPPLNKDPNDGAWQYNYLIWDGGDFSKNFGPMARPGGIMPYIEQVYCPFQQNPYHRLATPVNPWPVRPNLDTRAGYGRRFGLSGKKLSQIRKMIAYAADVLHIPEVVLEAHRTGVNVVYTDGHVQWVENRILVDNDLTKPFRVEDNEIVEKIWKRLDDAGR